MQKVKMYNSTKRMKDKKDKYKNAHGKAQKFNARSQASFAYS